MRLSKEAERAVIFASQCAEFNIEPADMAQLCTASKAYTNAAVRECNVPGANTDRQDKALRLAARKCGIERIEFPALQAEFTKGGQTFRAVHFGE